MSKPTLKTGFLGLSTDVDQKKNPFIGDGGLYTIDGAYPKEASSLTKFQGISKFTATPIDESSIGGSGKIVNIASVPSQLSQAVVSSGNASTYAAYGCFALSGYSIIIAKDTVSSKIYALRSSDGNTWTKGESITDGGIYTLRIGVAPSDIYIWANQHAYKSTDLGATWTDLGATTVGVAGHTVSASMKYNTYYSKWLYDFDGGVLSSTNGLAWTLIAPGIHASGINTTIHQMNSSICVAGPLYISGTWKIFQSSDGGTTWTSATFAPNGYILDTNSLLSIAKVSSSDEFLVVVSKHVGKTYAVAHKTSDFVTWVSSELPLTNATSIEHTNGMYVVIGARDADHMVQQIAVSPGFATWSTITLKTINDDYDWSSLDKQYCWGELYTSLTYTRPPQNLFMSSIDGTKLLLPDNEYGYGSVTKLIEIDFNSSSIKKMVATSKTIYQYDDSTELFSKLSTKLDTLPLQSKFVSMVPYNNALYFSNETSPFFYKLGCDVQTMGIAAPITTATLAAGSATGLTGNYSYKFTFYNANTGDESNPSPATNTVNLSNQKGSLSSIPVSSDSQVTGRSIYRTTAGGAVWLWLADIEDNTTTTYTDSTTNDNVLDIAVDEFGNGVPPVFSQISIWNDTAFMSEKNSSTIWFSKQGKPAAVDSNDYRDLDFGDGYNIVGHLPYLGALVVFKQNSIWNLFGEDRYTYGFTKQVPGVGAVNRQCIVQVPVQNKLLFIDPNGQFYFYNGNSVQPTAINIDPIMKGLNTAYLDKIVGCVYKPLHQCRWVVPNGVSTTNNLMIWYDYIYDVWGTRSIANTETSYIATLPNNTGSETCYLGGYFGQVWDMDTGTSDDSSAITMTLLDRGSPAGQSPENGAEEIKCFSHLFAWFEPLAGATASVYTLMDAPDATPELIGTLDLSLASGQDHIHFKKLGRRCYIKIVESSTTKTPTIRGWMLYYKNLGRHNAP